MYVEFVYKSSTITIIENVENNNYNDCILGFWHGDSFSNYLLLKDIKKRSINLDVIVTADRRGDYISDICKNYNVNPIRVSDGVKIKESLKEVKNISNIANRSFMVSLDGPRGPKHIPKKLAFMLSNNSKKDFVIISSKIDKKIELKNRWDNYVIPLPFNNIEFYIEREKYIDKEILKNFDTRKYLYIPKENIKEEHIFST